MYEWGHAHGTLGKAEAFQLQQQGLRDSVCGQSDIYKYEIKKKMHLTLSKR